MNTFFKGIHVLLSVVSLAVPFASKAQKENYTQIMTIKQPYFSYNSTKYQDTKESFQKVNGMVISESQKFLVISYAYNPTHFAIYKVGTWEQMGVYKIMGAGVELYGSYFSDDDKQMFVKCDRYSAEYKVIDFATGYIRKLDCTKTPKGCDYVEVQQEFKEAYTSNRKYYATISKIDPSDVIVYIKQTVERQIPKKKN